MDKINNIMHLIRELTDEDIEETREMINTQLTYTHPLKMAKTTRIQRIAKHNKKMLDQLDHLRYIVNDFNVDEGVGK